MTNGFILKPQLRTDWARRQLVVVLTAPDVVPVREVHVAHDGRVVRVLRARPVPMGVVGATLIRKCAL